MYKLPDGKYADGSWELNIYVTNLELEKQIRVTGDLHIGGVMLKLVESLGKTSLIMSAATSVPQSYHQSAVGKFLLKRSQPCNRFLQPTPKFIKNMLTCLFTISNENSSQTCSVVLAHVSAFGHIGR